MLNGSMLDGLGALKFDPPAGLGGVANGGAVASTFVSAFPLSLMTDDTVVLSFFEETAGGNGDDVLIDITFVTQAPAPIPVPAAGGLLLSAVLAGGFAARRKAKAA